MRRYVPRMHTLLVTDVVVNGSNGIATSHTAHVLHHAADTPALLDINARPAITKRNRHQCDACALRPLCPSTPQPVEGSSVCACVYRMSTIMHVQQIADEPSFQFLQFIKFLEHAENQIEHLLLFAFFI